MAWRVAGRKSRRNRSGRYSSWCGEWCDGFHSGVGRLTDDLAIGVLNGLIHRDILDDVIRECGKREKRSRLLPAHVVMYYVLALNLSISFALSDRVRSTSQPRSQGIGKVV